MKKKINLIFILTVLFISIGTVVRAEYCSSCGQSAGVTYQATSAGSRGHYTKICDNCGAPVGNVTSHTYGGWSSNGWNAGHSRTCTTCGYTATESHNYGSWEKHNETYCRQYCRVCNGYSSSQHTGGTATCTSGPICSRCGSEYGSALGHSYSSATCTTAATCSRCGTTSGSALGHNWGSYTTIKAATCTTSGTMQRTCSRCSTTDTATIPATGHTTPSSYSTTSTQHYKNCTSCSTRLTTGNHVDSDSNGYCDVCNYVMTFTISYNANGGSGAPSSQTKYPGTALTLSTTVPTKTGYIFLGWSTSSTATTATYQPGGSYTTDASTTLYAVWELVQFDITLNPTTYTYDGTSKTPSVTVKKDGTTLTVNTDYTIKYANNINAGTASVIITGSSAYGEQSVAKVFTINKKTLTVTINQLTKEYGQSDPTFTYSYSGQVGSQTPAYTGSASRATGENVGSYAISKGTFALKDNGTFLASNYNVSFASTSFTITTRDINKTQVTYKKFWKYTGSAITPDIVVNDGTTTLKSGTDYTVTYSDNTEMGTAKITLAGKGNYSGTREMTFVINEGGLQYDQIVLDLIPPVISNIEATSNESAVIINATITDPEVSSGVAGSGIATSATRYSITTSNIRPATSSTAWYSTNVVPTTSVGTLYLWIMAKDNVGNVSYAQATIKRSADDQYIEFVVDLTAPTISDMKATVNNQTITITATLTDPAFSNGDAGSGVNTSATRYAVTQTNTQPSASSSDWKTSNTITTSLTGTVYAWIKAVDNVGNTSYKSVSVDLTRPMSEITVSGINSQYTYTGSNITPEPTVKDGSTVLVKGTDYTLEYKDNLNVGTATITIKGAGKYVGIKEVTFTIVKASSTNPTLTGSSAVYDGASHTITASEVTNGTVNYRISTDNTTWGSWTTTKPSLTNVGKLYVQAKVVGDSNHNDTSATTSVILEVTARPITVTAGNSIRAYNGSALTNTTASVTSGSLVAGHTISATTSGSITNVGSVTNTLLTVKVMNGSTDVTSNYNITKANGTLTITKATALITVNPTSVAVAQGSSTTVTITYSGDGTLSAVSAATGIATATLSGKTITVKGVVGGTTTITVSVTGTTNYDIPTAVTIQVTVYGMPSAPTITPSRTTWGNTDVTFTMTRATPPVGGQTLQYKIGDGSWTYYPSSAVTVSTEGETTVYGRAINTTSTGLVSNTVSFVAKIDKTAPSTTAPTASATSNSITAVCNQTDSLSGINASLTRYRLLASDGTTVVKDWQTSNVFTGLTVSTTYQVQTRVTDNAGNTTESLKLTKATTAAPTGVTEIVTTPTAWTNGDVTVTITYPTISGYTNKIYKVGSGNEQTYTASFTVSVNTTVTAYLKDSVGNVAASKTVTISNIDKVKPTVTVSGIIGRTIKLTLADSASGVNGYAITTTNTAPAASSFTAVTAGATATVSTKVATTGTYYAWAKDVAGNISTATAVTVAEPILMEETFANVYTNKYILGNSTIAQRRADVAIISIEDTLPAALPNGAWDVSKDKNGTVYAWLTENVTDSTKYDLHIAADGNVIASSGYYLFGYYTNCTSITGLDKLNTSNATDMSSMFSGCSGLTSLDVSKFNTSNVTNMSYMFMKCRKLTDLDVSSLNTSNVTNMSYMFWYCTALTTLDVTNFDTSNVTSMSYMFAECQSLTTLDLSSFNTSKVTSMSQMFQDCDKLKQLNISSFDTGEVKDMSYMFSSCRSLTSLDLSNFDTSKVTGMAFMFQNCYSLTSIPTGLDLSNTAITSNDSTYNGYAGMFCGCRSLTSATINSKYIGYQMFYGCNKLTDITITSDVQGVYNSGTGTPSGAFKYTSSGKLLTILNSLSTAITKDNYDWAADNRIFDAEGPEVTFTYYNNTTYAKSQNVKVTVTDMSAINTSSLKYIWSQSTTAPTESTFTSNGTAFTNGATITKSTESGNNWYLWVIAKDEYGNTTITKSDAVYLDNTVPTVTCPSSIVYGSNITLTLKDNASGVNGWQVTTSETAPTSGWTMIVSNTNTSAAYTPASVGTHYAWAKDEAGNVSLAASFKVTQRAITVTAGSASRVYNGSALTNNTATVTEGSLVSGHTISVTTSGSITNVGSVTNTLVEVKVMNGSTDVTSNYNITKANGTLTITKADAAITVNPTSVIVAQGSTSTVTITYNGDGTLNATSAATGIATTTLSGKTITVKGVAGGTTTITVSVTGASNYNTPTAVTIPVTVYGKPSAPTITPSRTTWGNTNVTFTMTGATAPQGGQTLQYKIGNGSWTNYPGSAVTVSIEEETTVYGRAINTSSTSLVSGEVSFVAKIDKTAPTNTAPTASATSNSITAVCNQTDSLSGINASLTRYRLLASDGTTVVKDWQTSNVFTGLTVSTTYQVQTRVTDNAGNTTESLKLTKATTAAPTGVTEIVTTPTSWTNGDVTVTITYPAIDGYTNKVYKVGNGSEQTYTSSFTVSENTTVTAYLKDATGNIAASKSAIISNIDKVKPTVTCVESVVYGNSITLTLKDNASGVNGWQVTTSETAPTSGWTTITSNTNTSAVYTPASVGTYYAWAKDEAGNVSLAASFKVTQRAITVTAGSASRVYNGSALSDKTATVTEGSLVTGHTISVTTSGSITNVGSVTNTLVEVKVMNGSTDVTSNYNITKANGTLTITKADAAITVNPTTVEVAQGSTKTVTITYNGDGTLSAVSTKTSVAKASLTGKIITVEGVAGGTTTITVSVTGASNYNTPTAVTIPVTVYGKPSAPTITPSRTTWGNTNVTFTMTGATAPQGGQTLQYKIGNGSWTNYPGSAVTVSIEGETTVYGRAINTSSTSLVSGEVSFVAKIDKTAPTNTAPTASATSNSITAVCNQTDSLSGINASLTRYRLLASDGTTVVKDWQTSNVFTGLTVSTTYQIQTRVTDNAGNTTESLKLTKATTAAPTGVTEIVTTPTSWTNGDVTVTITYPTIDGYINKKYKIGSGNEQTYTSSFTVSENTTVTAYLKDATGNIAASKSAIISNIDKVKPTVTCVESVVYGNSITLTLKDNASGVNGWQVTTSETAPTSGWTTITSNTDTSAVYTPASVGTYYAWAKDEAGNVSLAASFKVTQRAITVTAGSASRVYNGSALSDKTATVTEGSLVTGHTISVTTSGSITNVGSVTNTLVEVKVMSDYTDVTSNYNITKVNGTLTITKADAAITVNPTSVIVAQGSTSTVTITYNGDGTLNATSAATGIATATLSGKTITVKGVAGGTTTITVSVTGASNYNTPTAVTIPVTVYGKPSAPTITPSRTTWGNTNVTFTMTGATAPQGGQTLQYKIGNGSWINYPGSAVTVSIEGETTVYGRAVNTSYADLISGEASFVSKVDKTLPTVTCVESIVYGESITLTLKDNGSGVDGWQVTKTTTTPTSGWTTITASTNTSTTFTPTAVGTYYAWAKDAAGNVSAYAKYTVTEKNISTSSDITASLEYTTIVYDGNAKKPQTIVMDGTYQLKSGTDYDVAYTNNTNVGTATVTITAKGNYTGTITLTFTITNASMEVTATGYTGVYDGNAHGITVTAPTGSTIKYGTTSGTYDLIASPAYTNVGIYTVYYKVSRANYTDVTGSAKVIITAKSMTGGDFTITLNQTVYTYDGTAHTPNATVKENGTTLASGNYTVTYKDNIDVGTATATITGKGNYTGSVTRSFTINKKTLTITPTAGQSKTFGDVEPNLLYEVSGAVGSQTATFTGYLSRAAGENVGKYAITQGTLALVDYNDFKASNYVISFVEGVEFEIKQKTLTSSDIKASLEYTQTTYDGTEKKPSVTVTEDGATLANTNYSVAYSTNINAGTAKVTITGKVNYSGSITLNFTINKRTLTVTPTAGQNKTYGEADPTLTYTYTNNVSGQTPKFKGALERATGENVGTYAINQGSIALANNGTFLASNYTLVFTTGVKFEIKAKAMTSNDITITIKTPTYTYDGTAHTPSVEVKDGTTVVAAANYTVTYTNNTNAGTATVKVTGKSNYSGEKTATFIINKRDLTVTPTANQSKIYGASDPTLTYTYTNNVSGETPKFTGSLTRAVGETVGTYAISKGTLALADNSKFLANNYNLVFTSGVNFTIVEKGIGALEITLSNNTYEYDGTAHTPTVTVKDGSTTLTNGTHYTITYKDNIDAGTATVTITGNGDYEGTTSKTFTITAKKLTVTPNAGQSKIYGAVDPTFTYTSNGTISGQTVKFTGALSRESGNAVDTYNILQGTLALTDNGIFKASNYTLVFTTGVKFEIKAKAMTSNDITITVNMPTGGYIYDGTAKTPSVTVKDGTTTLGTSDYTVTYTNNVNAGTATVKVTGKSNYAGEKTATFTIGKRDLNVTPASGQNKTYGITDPILTYTYTNNVTGETPKFTGKLSRESGESVGTYNILQGTLALADNSPFLANNYNLVFASGVKFEIKAKSMTSSDVKINISIPAEGYTYDGTAKEPTVTVYDGSTLVSAANYTVTYSNNINAGDDAVVKVIGKGNYFGEKTDYFTINKRNLNVTPTANQSKVYGTNDKTLTYTYSNNVTGETPKFIGSLARAIGENVGEYEITIGTLALEDNSKFLASNYNIVLATGVKFKITAKALSLNDITITLAGTSFVYDATAKRMGVTVTDGVGTLRLNTDYTLTYSNNINAGNSATVIIKGAGNYTGEVARTYTINKRDLTVTPKAGQNKTYGEADPTFTYTYTNNVSGQTPAFTGSLARATGEAVGTYAITQGTLALKDNNTFLVSNYNLVFTDNVMFEIKSKSMTSSDITITINIPTGGYTYDGTAKEPGVAVTDNGKEVSSANYTVTYSNNVNAGSNATVTVTGKGNYKGEKTATFTIAKRTLRVTPTAGQSKIYGSADPTLTYEYSNNVSGEIPKFTGSLTRAAGENVGTYAINQGTIALADNGSFLVSNYTLSFTTGVTFEIKEKGIGALTITVAKGPFTYDGTAKTPSVTVADRSTTLKEGTDYTVMYSNNINAGTAKVTITGKGDYTGSVTKEFTIEKRSLTVTPNASQSKVYGEADPSTLTYGYTGNVSGETPKFSGSIVRQAGENVGTYAITQGTLALINNGTFLTNNYNLVFASNVTFEIKAKGMTSSDITITVNIPTEGYTYDGTAKTPTVVVKDGTKTLNESDYNVSYSNNVNAGNNATVKVTGVGNYSGEKTATFTIGKRNLNVTPKQNQEKTYGAADPTSFTYDYSNNVSGETPKFTGSLTRDAGETVGKYNINQGTLALANNTPFLASNYNLVFTTGVKFTITEKSANGFTVTGINPSYEFTNSQIAPVPTVKDGTETLVPGQDYKVTYGENVAVGKGTVIIEGIGNYTGTKEVTFNIVDTTPPTVPSIIAKLENVSGNNYDGTWTNKNVWVNLTSTDLAGIVAYEWSTSSTTGFGTTGVSVANGVGTITFDADRNATIYFRAKDANGNYSGTSSMTLKVDKTAPTNVKVNTSVTTSTITAQVTSVDGSISGVKEYEFYLDGVLKSTQTGTSYTFTGLKDGTEYTVTVKVRDNAGNVTSEIGTTPAKTTTDGISNNITLTPDTTAWVNRNVIVTIEWPNTILTKQIKVGNGAWTNYDGTTYAIEENTTIYARLTDGENVGNGASLEISNIDKVKPEVKVSAASIVYGNSVTLTFTDDLSGINGWAITRNTTAPTMWTQVTPASLEATETYKPTAVGTYYAWIKDQAGNVSVYAQFVVTEKDISTSSDIQITLADTTFIYDGTAKEIGVTVKENGAPLVANTDYEVTYSNNINAGTATVVVKGAGNYKGEVTKQFTINRRALNVIPNNQSKVFGEADPELTYTYSNNVTGETPKFDKSLTRDSGENVGSYNITQGTLTLVDNGSFLANNYTIVFTTGKTLTITRKTIGNMTARLGQTTYTYDGTEKKPSVTVTDGQVTLIASNYTVAYSNNVNAGTATVTITGVGNYSGTITLEFTINARELVVKPDAGLSKIYGETDPVLTYTHSGAVTGETPKFSGSLARATGEDVGAYPIGIGTLALVDNGAFMKSNYKLVFSSEAVNFTIIPAVREVTIDPNGGSYNGVTKPQTVQGEVGTTITLDNPVRDGYKFIGWTLTGGGKLVGNKYTFEMTSGTVTANWEDNSAPTKPILTSKVGGPSGDEYVPDTWINRNVYIEAKATDNVGVKAYQYQVNGTTGTWTEMPMANGIGSMTITEEGIVTIYVRAVDAVGNVSEVESLIVKIDKTAPTGTVVINDDAMYVNDTNVILTLTAQDNLSEVTEMSISNTPEAATFEPFSETKRWTLTSGDGQKTVYVVLKDAAGNMTSTIWE